MDSVLSFHTGCPGTPENQIICVDDSGACTGDLGLRRDAYLSFTLDAGQTVTFSVKATEVAVYPRG